MSDSSEADIGFPEGTVPENRLPLLAAHCSYTAKPYALVGMYVQMLRDHFVDASNIMEPKVRKLLQDGGAWRPSENGELETGVLIESLTKWQPNDEELRPALLVRRNKWAWQRTVIGDFFEETLPHGTITYTKRYVGSHTIFALSTKPAEAELLSMEVGDYFMRYSPLVVEQMGLQDFAVGETDGLHQVIEASDHYVVPVTLVGCYDYFWQNTPHAPRLKRIKFKASDLM